MNRRTFSVSDMACEGCSETVENALGALGGVSRAEADHENDTVDVVVDDGVADEELRAAIENAGYDVVA